jgi:hypothetical protein
MRKVAGSPAFWLFFTVLSFVLHAWWAWTISKGAPLARVGGIWIVAGVVITARAIVRKGYGNWLATTRIIGGGSFKPSKEEIEAGRQSDLDMWGERWMGPILVCVGTLLFAYGDIPAQYAIDALRPTSPSN